MDKIQYTGMTDVGRKRSGNEDRFHVATCWTDKHLLALCIDGCGGYAGGEVASEMTVKHVLEYLDTHREGEKVELLKQAIIHANNIIHETRDTDPALHRMCCVATAAMFEPEQHCIHMVHVGDSRLYAVSGERIIKLSHDHSPIGRDEEAGILTETEAMQSPSRNIIERAIGEKHLEADTDYLDTEVYPMAGGITWLFCSDGLTDMITSAEIVDVISQHIPLADKAERLIAVANEAGGKDNITVVLVQTEGEADHFTEEVMDKYANMVTDNDETDYDRLMSHMFRDSEDEEDEIDEEKAVVADTTETDENYTSASEPGNVSEMTNESTIDSVQSVSDDTSIQQPVTEPISASSSSTDNGSSDQKSEQSLIPAPKAVTTVTTKVQPKLAKIYIWIGMACVLIAVTVALLLHLKKVKEEERWQREEVIREEIRHRELYYNINDKAYLLHPDNQ